MWPLHAANEDGGVEVRRLTDRQVAVLAAIERIGGPTQEELRRDLAALSASEITRVINALVIRGLVAESGKPVRFRALPRDHRTGQRDSVPAGD
jgi:DNA-binding MarR family transcriptional regulator